jgi:hypothetical protein
MKAALLLLLLAHAGAPVQTGTVTGVVRDAEGRPQAGKRVAARAATAATGLDPLVGIGTTGETGRYRLEASAGRYYVVAGLLDLPTYYPGFTELQNARVVEVGARATVTGIDITMASPIGVRVSGRAVLPAGWPAPTGQRAILTNATGFRGETNVESDGAFEFSRIPPGAFNLSISFASTAPHRIAVSDKDLTGIEVQLRSTKLSVSVVVEDGSPPPSILLSFSSGEVQRRISIRENPRWTFDLAEGDYLVSAINLPRGYFLKSLQAGSSISLEAPVSSSPNTVMWRLSVDKPFAPLVITLGAHRVAGVQFRGNRDALPAAVLSSLRTKAGDVVREESIARDIRTLHASKRFDDIVVELEDGPTGGKIVVFGFR